MTALIRIASFAVLLLLTSTASSAQTDVDVHVEIELANDMARGGEPFSFTARITNAGTGAATDVVLLDDSYKGDAKFEITSAVSQKGECELIGQQNDRIWRCRVGTLAPGETVTANFAGELDDYDGNYFEGSLPDTALGQPSSSEAVKQIVQGSGTVTHPKAQIATVSAMPENSEKDTENNHANVQVHVRPSRNQPPKVGIIPPANRLLTRPAKKSTTFEIRIEAFDPDGTIEKVVVYDPKYGPRPVIAADAAWQYLGRSYTTEALDAFLKSNPPPERLAQRTGKNTFVYKLSDPAWGRNNLSVAAYDNGGRASATSTDFFVKGDATIEILSPKKDQIIAPGSTVVIETLSRVNEGPVKEVYIFNTILVGTPGETLPKMELVSKQGNVYRHRYLWKNVRANHVFTAVQVGLIEGSGAITESEPVTFLPRNVSKINFTSIRNGQVFANKNPIEIRFDASDRNSNDRFRLYIDGKFRREVYGGFIWNAPEPGAHTIQIVAECFEVEVGRSELITIQVQ